MNARAFPLPRSRRREWLRPSCTPVAKRWRSWAWVPSTLLLLSCAGLPEFTPGVTHRAEVLLALGEPVLALHADTVLVHAWTPGGLMIPARRLYRHDAGVLRRTDLAMPDTWPGRPGRTEQPVAIHHVVHEFDAQGVLVRRLP
jgi:hypothetical protein